VSTHGGFGTGGDGPSVDDVTTTSLKHSKPSTLRRAVRHPLGWCGLGTAAIALSSGLLTAAGPVGSLLAAAVALALYVGVMRLAGRRTPELSRTRSELLRGAGVGLAFVLGSFAVIAALGGYSLHWDPQAAVLGTLVAVLGASVTEELVFRGLAFQALERWRGPHLALAVTAALFGVIHLLNPGASLWSSVAITLEAGILLGAAFWWRRNLWFAIGLHAAWNAAENLLGIPVSGHAPAGLWQTTTSGSSWLTGGSFGLEASVVPVLLSLVLAVPMLLAARRGNTPASAS
jgi:uncharacterized protein